MSSPTPELFARLQAALGESYRLERELGRGGMGVVFLASDTTLDRQVAVKVVHPELAAHPSIARRFLAEARLIARLRHPNIVAVHAAGSTSGAGDDDEGRTRGSPLLWYVMDQVPGESLRNRLNREGRLPVVDAARIAADLAAALDAAGEAGVVHRDVKPENVLLESGTGRALLADFGIARAMAADESGATTGRGVAVGTPAYMSPEQAAGEEVDGRSDLYALGIVAYEMLAGRPPFEGPGRVIVSKHLAERPAPIERVRSDCPPGLAHAVMRSLEKQPSARWQSGAEFRAAVEGGKGRPPRTPWRRRTLAAVSAAVLLAVAATVGLARRGAESPPDGVDPRRSILVLPFDNLRDESSVEWMRDGSVSMLGLNLSQWNDLTVVDYERLHDLLSRHRIESGQDIGLDMARRLAREAGVWTVVLGDYTYANDSLHVAARVYDVASGRRVDVAQVRGPVTEDVRPMFDELAARLLDLSGAPGNAARPGLASATTQSLEAFRAYLRGVERLNHWELGPATREFERAVELDSAFGLAYYKLALARGWAVGMNDSVSDRAMVLATANSRNLPEHERTVIAAYRSFIQSDFARARDLYGQLIARDTTDTEAWYGLGEAWFHDTTGTSMAPTFTEALRAFKRTLALDANYTLAYDHVRFMLTEAARPTPYYVLLPNDSFGLAWSSEKGAATLDSATVRQAIARARQEEVAIARDWVASQPATTRAHSALVDAYLHSENYNAALAEVARFRATSPNNPELPFVEARIRFAAGEADRAADGLRLALDSVAPEDFSQFEGTQTVLGDIANAANVFAYQGDLVSAAKAIDLADEVRGVIFPTGLAPANDQNMEGHWRRMALADLYASVGAPAASLRRIWDEAAEEVRAAPANERKHITHAAAPAAIGLFTGLAADSTALTELAALSGEPLPKELRALLALSRQDSAGARRALAEPDPEPRKLGYPLYSRPLAAQAYYALGEYERALELLETFEPANLPTRGFDARWGLMARVRLLRGAAYEKLGRPVEAGREYRLVLTQWKAADPALQPFVRQAQQGLGRTMGTG